MSEFPMTLEGKKRLDEELNRLIKVDREEVKKAIAEARAHGDLKENAEYHAAKEKQSHIEGRILELQNKIAKAKVVDVSKMSGTKVLFGASVQLYDPEKDKTMTFQIVGEDEARSGKDKVSFNSPLAKALIGKEVGDEIIVRAPKGDMEYELQSIEYR